METSLLPLLPPKPRTEAYSSTRIGTWARCNPKAVIVEGKATSNALVKNNWGGAEYIPYDG